MRWFFVSGLLVVWLGFISLSGCKPTQSSVVVPLVLLVPMTVHPAGASMQRGDTLWLEANFSDSLLDLNSSHRYQVRPQDMQFNTYIAIKKLQGIGQVPIGAASTFQVVNKIGELSIGGANTGVFYLDYDGHTYRGKFGLIPTQPGVMSISLLLTPPGGANSFGRFIPFIQLPLDSQGREQKATLDDMFFIINEGKQVNYDLYGRYATATLQAPAGVNPKNLIYEQQSTFTVEVK